MLSGMILPPTTIETLKPETHEGESWIESLEQRTLYAATAAPTDFEPVGMEMALHDSYHRTPSSPAKKPTGTAFNWHGTKASTDSGSFAAPIMAASVAVSKPTPVMSVRTSIFSQSAKFSDRPIAS